MFTVRLDESDRPALRTHFLALEVEDRRLRFGCSVSAAVIERYVEQIDFNRDAVFGVNVDTRSFEGIAHLALDQKHAELGLSVLPLYRRIGIGTALVSRASVHARNRQIDVLFMQCLNENRPIMRIAAALGMRVVTQVPNSEASKSSPSADLPSIALYDAALLETLVHHTSRSLVAQGEGPSGKILVAG